MHNSSWLIRRLQPRYGHGRTASGGGLANIIHASDAGGIVTIAQLQPIAVLFAIPEDWLPQVRAVLNAGKSPEVEAWNRDNSVKIATGRLVAMDNQIDQSAGTVNLKAMFDNKDGALFPNEFVNVRVQTSDGGVGEKCLLHRVTILPVGGSNVSWNKRRLKTR
jgi:multidrug efflux pump subunit AcrA (membrane-fusion protein)